MKQVKMCNLHELIAKAKDVVQFVVFYKRGTGEKRYMAFRIAGSIQGTGQAIPYHRVIEDIRKEIMTVWDLNENNYRRINLRDIDMLVINQEEYTIV